MSKGKSSTKQVRRCKGCGVLERKDALGYSNIAYFLGYCVDCIAKAVRS